MTYRNAKRLHNEDEVLIKEEGIYRYVISTEVDEEHKRVIILCDDGNYYHHRDVG